MPSFQTMVYHRRTCVNLTGALQVCFGRVIDDGLLVIRKLENVQTLAQNKPRLDCRISECGEM